jgi:predicted P-loop ATPase/GTPase
MKATKSNIEKAVRANDTTALFAMFKGDRGQVYEAVRSLSVAKLSKRAYHFAYECQRKFVYRPEKKIHTQLCECIKFAKQQVNDGSISTSYGKVLVEGNNNIYWASPNFGHSDYNKSRAFENTPENRILAKKINAFLLKHI